MVRVLNYISNLIGPGYSCKVYNYIILIISGTNFLLYKLKIIIVYSNSTII